MYTDFQLNLKERLEAIQSAGTYKNELKIISPQGSKINIEGGKDMLNFCSNNYLGLSNNQSLREAAKEAIDILGYGMSSVRFICGTGKIHKILERRISEFLGTEDTILYASCFDANGGVFEVLLDENDAIISDELNHASIIDGIRLCKAKRFKYKNSDISDLEEKLKEANYCRFKMIVTDGVFSMDGNIAHLDQIYELANKYNALVMVDESHSIGVVGESGKGLSETFNLTGKVEIITGTLGKALGGAIGGFTSGKKEIIEILRQKSRPYLFSNSIPPMVVAASIEALNILDKKELQNKLYENIEYFVKEIQKLGFDIKPTQSAICAIMLYDEKLTQQFAASMREKGIYVIGFSYPVVPEGKARIRVQISAAHDKEQLDKCIKAFQKVGRELDII